MARLKWGSSDNPAYQTGISKGVFYLETGEGIAWNGLTGASEKPQANAPTPVYNSMGIKYQQYGNVAEKKFGINCYTYPEEMDEYLGYEVLDDYGYLSDERPPKPFHMAFRVERGHDHYEIHVLLNQIATFNETSYQTISDMPSLSAIAMNLEGVPDPKFGTSHLVLDSRLPITKSAEDLLFGTEYADANILKFINAEPVWEDVAINYAPIIEPDYDNMVWLGDPPEGYIYDPSKPRPDNLVPGVKKLTASNRHQNHTLVYYDEIYGGIGVYVLPESTDTRAMFSLDALVMNTPLDCAVSGFQTNTDAANKTYTAGIVLQKPDYYSNVVKKDGAFTIRQRNSTITSRPSFGLLNHQPTNASRVTYRHPMITVSGYKGPFFDANTPIKERGNRYLRVERPGYDYTIHQQLRLRSMSTVLLSDITPWWYTLQASDTQLQNENGVFTFTGPQAVVYDDDTFTIDDEIYGKVK